MNTIFQSKVIMVDGSGSGSSEAIVASQSIVSTWLIPIMWRAGTFIGGLFFLAVGALYYKQVSRPTHDTRVPLGAMSCLAACAT